MQITIESARQAILRGEIKEALAFYEAEARAAEERAETGRVPEKDWTAASEAYREAAVMAMPAGELQKAITHGEKAVETADKAKAPLLQLNALARLRDAYRAIEDFDRAGEALDKQFAIAKQLKGYGKLNWESSLYAQRAADLLDRQGDYAKSIQDLHRSLTLNQEVLDNFHRWRVRYQQTPIEFYRGKRILFLALLAHAHHRAGNMDQAIEQYRRALDQLAEWKLDYFDVYRLHLGLGEVLLSRGAHRDAYQHLQRALAIAKRQGRSDGIMQASLSLAAVAVKLGDTKTAIRRYEETIRRIESSRSTLSTEEFRQSYFAGVLDVYTGMVDALVRSGKPAAAFDYSERARSRIFLDILATKKLLETAPASVQDPTALQQQMAALNIAAEVAQGDSERKLVSSKLEETENAYSNLISEIRRTSPEQASLISVEPLTLAQVQGFLEPQQALLEFLVTPERTYLWVVDKHGVKAVTIAISRHQLAAKVHALRTTIAELRPLKEYRAIAQDLYGTLVGPVASFLRGQELIVVPHEVLHYLPFQALYSPRGKYLVEDHAVTYLSSASLIQFTTAKRKPAGQKVLAFGNPSFELSKVNLPMSELEAEEIGRLYPQSEVFTKSEATEEKVKTLAADYDVLHFATHAELNKSDPLSSAVLLAKGGSEDGRLEVREIFDMNLNASLVVLSGCDTGLGQLSSGDELVGLTRAFIYAGTPSVVASLWKVDDASTAHLMSGFYRNLKTMSKVAALRNAQLEMIRGKRTSDLLARRGVGGVGRLGETPPSQLHAPSPEPSAAMTVSTSHPYFWAPFILVGDGK